MNDLHRAGLTLAAIGVGAREAVALGVIAAANGKAQAVDVKEALKGYSKDPGAVIAILKNKGLAKPEDNRNGWPFWRLTAEAIRRINAAKELTNPTNQ